MSDHLWLLLAAWIAYFVVHSLLATLPVKQLVASKHPTWMPRYRVLFNGIALLALLPVLYLWQLASGDLLWRWSGALAWIANGLAVAAIVGFVHSTRYYDMAEFFGLRQWQGQVKTVQDQERLRLSPYHRFVRHPWYFFALVLVWTRNMDTAWLLSASFITLYFVIGSRLEERKLRDYYGEVYATYCQRVPGIFPLPGRHLSTTEAREFESRAN